MVGLKDLEQIDYGVAYQRGEPSLTQQSGIAGLAAPAALDVARANQQSLARMRDFGSLRIKPPSAPAAPQGPVLAISRSSGKIWANGKLFSTDDAQGAIESEQFLNQPPVPAPAAEAGDWEELDPDAYAQHLQQIKNPSMGTLASKNFGIGVDNMQMLGGYGLQFLGATETGQAVVRQQLEDISKNAPYQRNFTDIGSDPNRGVLDWFVANLAQQGPNLVESVVTAAIGAGAGAAAGGGANPLTAAGGVVTSLVGKQAFKQAMLTAAKKYMAGEALDFTEQKLLREAAGITAAAIKEQGERVGKDMLVDSAGNITRYSGDDAIKALSAGMKPAAEAAAAGGRQQAMMGGATLASLGQNYATGVSDLYGESVEGGTPDRGLAALGGIPYAAMETLPEYIAAMRIFKGIGARTTALAGKSMLGKAGEVGVRTLQGGAAGAGLEGMTELGQESLGIGMNAEVDYDSPEGVSRLLNAFAAGAAIGGFIGAGSNMNTGKPHDMLSGGTKPADLGGQTLTGEIIPPTRPSTRIGPDGSVPLLGGPGAAATGPSLGGPAPMSPPGSPGSPVTDVQFSQPQAGGPAPMQGLPSASTIYNPAPTPSPMLTGPEIPQPPTPSVTPDVIPMGGPTTGSALQQAAEGTLTGGIPTGPLANRLQQQATEARARAAQQAEQDRIAAQQAELAQTSGSALARIGRGENIGMVSQPAPTTPAQQLDLPLGEPAPKKARLRKGKKTTAQQEAAPVQQTAPVVEETPVNAAKVRPQPKDNKLQRADVAARRKAAEASRGNRLKQGRKVAEEAQAEVSATPVHDKFVAEFDDARLNDANKVKLRAIVKRAQKAGVLTEKDMKELDIAFKDRDMTADDIAPLASSLIEANKQKPAASAFDKLKRATAPEEGKQDVPAEVREEVPEVKKPKEKLDPKSEGAAAAPAQKAEVDPDVLKDAGFTRGEINDYQRNGNYAGMAARAAQGYMYIGGQFRAVTKEDLAEKRSAMEEYRTVRMPQLIETIKKRFAEARKQYRDFGPDSKLGNVPYSDSPAVTEAEAIRMVESDYDTRGLAQMERQYARTEEAQAEREAAKAKPKAEIVVYNPAPIIDPEVEARLKREQARDEEDFAVSNDDAAIVNDLIVSVNTNDPDTLEYRDSLSALIGYANDPTTEKKLRAKVNEYLKEEFDPADLAAFQRGMKGAPTQGSLDFDTITTAMQQINNGERLGAKTIGALTAAWKRLKASNPDYGVGKLADYITGGPTFFNIVKGKVEPKGKGRYSISMWDKPDSSLNVGKIKLIIGKFVSKYVKQPKVYVFRNQADLKASDPALYKRAAAGRPGDFDTANAAGYSLGDEIIIFSDRIGSEDHLAFVLAHETIGHFGLRGLMGAKDFDALMVKLYDTDSRLKIAVDAAMAVRGMSKAEAVEEYLSDYAAQLHTSLVRRVWNGIKSVLNRVGIKFGDEATRYLLSQAKRYVKTGERTGVFETSSVMHRLWGVETGQTGRFATVDVANANERFADMIRHGGVIPMDMKDAMRTLKDGGWTWDSIKEAFFSLANYQALRNPGLYAFEKLLDETRQREAYIYNRYNTKLEPLITKSEAHRGRVSRMLMDGRVVSVYRLLEKPLGAEDAKNKLFKIDANGELILEQTVADEYKRRGTLPRKELEEGVTVQREEMGKDGKLVKKDYKFEGLGKITDDEYADYLLARDTIAEVEIELLRAKYLNYISSEKVSTKAINRMLKKSNLTDADRLVKRTANIYKNIYVSGYTVDERGNLQPGVKEIERADKFLEAVNRALIDAEGDRTKNDKALREFLDQDVADDFMASLSRFRDGMKTKTEEISFVFQNEMKRVVLDDVSLSVEEERAKRTMAGGYVPVIRDKAFEMRIDAFDENGKAVQLHEDMRQMLVYSQFDSLSQAERASAEFKTEFEGKTFEVWADKGNGYFETVKVTLRPTYGPALTETATDPALNLDEFLHGLRLFKINLSPDKMTKVIRELTASGDQLRKRLAFSNTPGYDKDSGVFAMTRHIQLRGATIAKTITRPRMRELLDRSNSESRDIWNGDLSGIFSTRALLDKETDPVKKQHYRHQLDSKLYMYRETYPGMKGWDGTKAEYERLKAAGGLEQNNENRFYNSAQRTMQFLEANKLVTESNFGAGRTASILRALTSILQLGGSIAQGVMNMVSPYTNWLPYMASYNQKNGFGGGFGVGKVMAAYQVALNQVGLKGMLGGKYNTAEFYEQLIRNKADLDKLGLTADEAEALAAEIREGKLIPAQSNALLGMARSGWSNRYWIKGVDLFMSPFNLTEQASRRSAFLAAYRLAKERNGAAQFKDAKDDAGKAEYEKLLAEARDFAVQSLDLTLGEYSVLNRPPAWRDGIQSFLYMYKVYPTTTIQMFRRLDKKGQIIMLGTLWVMAGVTGFPFAEDLEDLIDTIAQALGLQMGSVRVEFTRILEDIAPGLSPYVLRGAVNTALGIPADVASRFSMGDFVPGTGILLAGSTVGEEVKDILGPMPAMALGAAASIRDLVSVPFSESKTVQGTLRAAPVTALRMVGDSWAYLDNGAVVDRRGYVVSPEMSLGTIATRLLGFYPKSAAEQYEAIKYAKRVNNYQKEIVAGLRMAWIREYNARNFEGMRQIEATVEEWNRSAKGTGLEISNFKKNSMRAAKEANMSAAERTLRATSKAGREDTASFMDAVLATE